MSVTVRQSSSDMSVSSPNQEVPALLISTSSPPQVFSMISKMRLTSSGSLTSPGTGVHFPPEARISCSTSLSFSRDSLQLINTCHPAPANASAHARPIPLEEPVMRIFFLFSMNILLSGSCVHSNTFQDISCLQNAFVGPDCIQRNIFRKNYIMSIEKNAIFFRAFHCDSLPLVL